MRSVPDDRGYDEPNDRRGPDLHSPRCTPAQEAAIRDALVRVAPDVAEGPRGRRVGVTVEAGALLAMIAEYDRRGEEAARDAEVSALLGQVARLNDALGAATARVRELEAERAAFRARIEGEIDRLSAEIERHKRPFGIDGGMVHGYKLVVADIDAQIRGAKPATADADPHASGEGAVNE